MKKIPNKDERTMWALRLPRSVRSALDHMAAASGRNRTEVICWLITEHYNEHFKGAQAVKSAAEEKATAEAKAKLQSLRKDAESLRAQITALESKLQGS